MSVACPRGKVRNIETKRCILAKRAAKLVESGKYRYVVGSRKKKIHLKGKPPKRIVKRRKRKLRTKSAPQLRKRRLHVPTPPTEIVYVIPKSSHPRVGSAPLLRKRPSPEHIPTPIYITPRSKPRTATPVKKGWWEWAMGY